MSKIRDIRKKRGLSQQALVLGLEGKGVYIHRTTVANYESGRITPSVAVLRSLAQFFGTTMEDLMETEEQPTHV